MPRPPPPRRCCSSRRPSPVAVRARYGDALPAPTRQLLLIAAAEPVGDPVLVRRAADQLGIDAAFAEIDGLLSMGERVTFRHPLVRSALYGSAPAAERRAVHLALAAATD